MEAMHRRVSFLLFAAGWGANHFATLLIVYRTRLSLGPPSLGLLYGVYALGLVPGLVLAGRISDRRGRRPLVLPAPALVFVALRGTGALAVLSLAVRAALPRDRYRSLTPFA